MSRYLIIDSSNILYKSFYVHNTEDDITLGGFAAHSALTTINKYYNKYKPDKIIMTFDRPSWRIDYTKSEQCISGLVYKGERRKKQTAAQKERYVLFKQHVQDFENFIVENTSIICMLEDKLEADDLMSGAVQILSLQDPDNEMILVSADKDLMQLLRYDNTYLIDPATGNERTLEDYDNDAGFFMFEKCFRGEGGGGDNVQSAYPRLRSTKIKEAYTDDFKRSNLMNHTWEHPVSKKQFKVGDLFNENELLMDLERQPDDIQELIVSSVLKSLKHKNKFNYVNFLQYCKKHDLVKVLEQSDKYIQLLSS